MSEGFSGGAYQWQKQRRRPGVALPGKIPVSGFGAKSDLTLWLLSPIATRKYKFKNGKPYLATVGTEITDSNIISLREKVLKCIKVGIPTEGGLPWMLRADVVLMEYAAALILHDYDVTDEELEMLLPAGNPKAKWIKAIATHAIGGQDVLDQLAIINPEALAAALTMETGTPVNVASEPAEEKIEGEPIVIENLKP